MTRDQLDLRMRDRAVFVQRSRASTCRAGIGSRPARTRRTPLRARATAHGGYWQGHAAQWAREHSSPPRLSSTPSQIRRHGSSASRLRRAGAAVLGRRRCGRSGFRPGQRIAPPRRSRGRRCRSRSTVAMTPTISTYSASDVPDCENRLEPSARRRGKYRPDEAGEPARRRVRQLAETCVAAKDRRRRERFPAAPAQRALRGVPRLRREREARRAVTSCARLREAMPRLAMRVDNVPAHRDCGSGVIDHAAAYSHPGSNGTAAHATAAMPPSRPGSEDCPPCKSMAETQRTGCPRAYSRRRLAQPKRSPHEQSAFITGASALPLSVRKYS